MYVKQISIFVDNTRGSLAKLMRLLADAGLDMYALSIAETQQFGIVRIIVSNTDKCVATLRDNGYTARLTDVLAVCVPDRPGGLAEVLEILYNAQVDVEYLYSMVRSMDKMAIVIFYLSDPEKGAEVLYDNGVRLLSQNEIGGSK